MSLYVFVAVLAAAALHAGWNAVVKLGADGYQSILAMSVAQGIIGLVMIAVFPLPNPAGAWPWLLATAIVHTFYKLFLAAAYERGDLSRVYPISRGSAPVMVAIFSIFILSEAVATQQYAGIFLVGIGIMLMARGIWSGGEATSLLPYAVYAAICTATYSVIDGLGARIAGSASAFTGWLFFLDAVLVTLATVIWRGRRVIPNTRRMWTMGSIAGTMSLGAYWIVIWAMTVAPIPLVTALRETSVLFATAIGIIWMGEPAHRSKIIAACLILAGIIAIRL